MSKQFRVRINTDLNFGVGILKDASQIIRAKGFERPALIVDKGVSQVDLIKEFIESLKQNFLVMVFENPVSEPNYEFLDEFKKILSGKNFDCVIGIGGGSTMDLAKGMAVLLANEGPAISFKGFPKLKNKPLPVITIPTLAGTGSEIAFNAVFTDSKQKMRLGINTELNFPALSIVDPLLSITAPRKAVISAAMDCLCHAIESFIYKNASSFTQELAKSAFFYWHSAVTKLINNFDDLDGRSDLFLASIYANMAVNNSGGGLGGDFSYPLGAQFGVPHGIGEGIFLPSLYGLYVDKGYLGFSQLYDVLPEANKQLDHHEKNKLFVELIRNTYLQFSAPTSLAEFGISTKDIPLLIDKIRNSFKDAPVKFDECDAQILFEQFIK